MLEASSPLICTQRVGRHQVFFSCGSPGKEGLPFLREGTVTPGKSNIQRARQEGYVKYRVPIAGTKIISSECAAKGPQR